MMAGAFSCHQRSSVPMTVMDMIIESGNDLCEEEYSQVATQADFDAR
jgi:hypothetical protein